MLLFTLSFLIIFASSYLLTSIITPKNNILGAINLFIIFFAQIVFSLEVLSLFSAIKPLFIILVNIAFFLITFYFWYKSNRGYWTINPMPFLIRFKNSILLDKSLMVLSFGFIILILGSIFLCCVMPITSADASGYHYIRALFWAKQGNFNHFEFSDVRALCMPINSEIIYTWIFALVKKDVFSGFISFFSYLCAIISMYGITGLLGYSTRKKLWVVFVLSSFSSVIVQVSGNETDIVIAALVSSSVFLFWSALRENKTINIFMASLAYALAIGTKTTAIMAIPAVGVLLVYLSFYYKTFKPLLYFLGFGLCNFAVFSMYNYVLNFMHYSNIIGPNSISAVVKNYYGIKGVFANLIKYFFTFLDFTGFKWGLYLQFPLVDFKNQVLTTLGLSQINDGLYNIRGFNTTMLEPVVGLGIVGVLAFLPTFLVGLFKPIFCKNSRKVRFLFLFALIFLINMISLSANVTYVSFSVRFIMFFVILSSPILVYSYFKRQNPFKFLVVCFCIFYLVFVSTHLWSRPIVKIFKLMRSSVSIENIRSRSVCSNYNVNPKYSQIGCLLADDVRKSIKKRSSILVFSRQGEPIAKLKMMDFENYNIDFGVLSNLWKTDIKKYDYIIIPSIPQDISNFNYSLKDIPSFTSKAADINYSTTDDDVICDVKAPIISSNDKNLKVYPYMIYCSLDKNFFKRQKFEQFRVVSLYSKILDDYDIYIIFKNTAKH